MECDTLPVLDVEVAVTVIGYVPAGVPLVGSSCGAAGAAYPPPLHDASPAPAAISKSNRSSAAKRGFLRTESVRTAHASAHTNPTSVAPGKIGRFLLGIRTA